MVSVWQTWKYGWLNHFSKVRPKTRVRRLLFGPVIAGVKAGKDGYETGTAEWGGDEGVGEVEAPFGEQRIRSLHREHSKHLLILGQYDDNVGLRAD